MSSDVLGKAKSMNTNLDATPEEASAEQVRAEQRRQWEQENAKAIQSYNNFIEANGVFSDGLRKF